MSNMINFKLKVYFPISCELRDEPRPYVPKYHFIIYFIIYIYIYILHKTQLFVGIVYGMKTLK